MKKIGISTDCMCDLPAEYLAENDINVLQFYIYTSTGRFWNESEITSDNILEYLGEGNVYLRSNVPEPAECRDYFEKMLTRYDEVIHITTSDKIGMSHPNALAALELMDENRDRVTLINSGSFSTGLGHMVMRAVTLRDEGRTSAEIAGECNGLRGRIVGTVIVPDADHLHRIGYVGRGLRDLCRIFRLHPVLGTTGSGKLTVKMFGVGNYERSVLRYATAEFKRNKKTDKGQLFITHAGCPVKIVNEMKEKADSLCKFDNVTVTKASAVISSLCGPGTIGIAFVRG